MIPGNSLDYTDSDKNLYNQQPEQDSQRLMQFSKGHNMDEKNTSTLSANLHKKMHNNLN